MPAVTGHQCGYWGVWHNGKWWYEWRFFGDACRERRSVQFTGRGVAQWCSWWLGNTDCILIESAVCSCLLSVVWISVFTKCSTFRTFPYFQPADSQSAIWWLWWFGTVAVVGAEPHQSVNEFIGMLWQHLASTFMFRVWCSIITIITIVIGEH